MEAISQKEYEQIGSKEKQVFDSLVDLGEVKIEKSFFRMLKSKIKSLSKQSLCTKN